MAIVEQEIPVAPPLHPMMHGEFEEKNIVTIDQFSRNDIEAVLSLGEVLASRMAQKPREVPPLLSQMVVKAVMFEDSSRTAGTFTSAAGYLGRTPNGPTSKPARRVRESHTWKRCAALRDRLIPC